MLLSPTGGLQAPAWAQTPWGPLGAPAWPPARAETYGPRPLLGVQPRLPAPGAEATSPVQPPPPSQSHLPALLLAPAVTAATAALDLHPSVTFSETYTDNFGISATDKVDNFRSTISPGLLVRINEPRTQGSVSASLGIAQDSVRSAGDVDFFPSLLAAVKYTFDPRLSVSFADTFTRSDEPSLGNQFGLQQQRRVFTSNTLGLSADWLLDLLATKGYYQLSTFFGATDTISHILGADVSIPLGRILGARAGYELSISRTSGTTENQSTENQSTGHLIWASLARQVSRLSSVGISTSYSFQSADNARIGNVSLFTTYELPGRLSLSGSLGYSFITSDSGEDLSTITTNTSASYRFAKAVISVAIFQDLNQTALQGQNFGIVRTRSYTGTFGYALTPFIETSLRASYSENQSTGVGNSAGSPDTTALSAMASLGWRIRQWLSMGLDYTYTRYTSGTSSGGAATENRVDIRLTASF